MAELKHTFTSGRMNKDLDNRLVPNGEYIDALNIQVSSSEGSDVGALENILGNEQLSDLGLNNAKTIGAYSYNLEDKIYWFVTSDTIDAIYAFNQKTKAVEPILVDSKVTDSVEIIDMSILSNVEGELVLGDETIAKSLIENYADTTAPVTVDEEALLNANLDLNVEIIDGAISIPKNTTVIKNADNNFVFKNIKYTGKDYKNIKVTVTFTRDGILNFSKYNLITGVNIVDGLLFWTDNLNQPRRININNFSNYTKNNLSIDTQINYETKDTAGNIIKNTRPFTEDDIAVIKKAPLKSPSVDVYDSKELNVTSLTKSLNLSKLKAGDAITISSIPTMPSWESGDIVEITNIDSEASCEASVKTIDTSSSSIELSILNISLNEENAEYLYDVDLKKEEPIYELNFVRFAYRWKYKNGEYSTFSPFSQPAFFPGEFKFDGKEAYNHGMINQARYIKLSEFDIMPDEVEEIDILFKETKNSNIYTLQTKKRLDFTGTLDIKKEQIHAVVESTQILRQWDNVPKRAKAQEVTANRVIYGNYTQNYDVYKDPEFNISLTKREGGYKRSIKSNRNYQIGVVYADEYNRQTPVLSNDSGSKFVSKSFSLGENKFDISLANNPPAWAKSFKYFIKETSAEYYNLAADRFYEEPESGFVVVSFPSSDRNKITEDSYLVLKKAHGTDEAIQTTDNRYKVIDIFSDPPEFVHEQIEMVDELSNVLFSPSFGDGSTVATKTSGATPVENNTVIQIRSVNTSGTKSSESGQQGIVDQFKTNLKVGNWIKFKRNEKKSQKYKIVGVRYHLGGDDECELKVEDPFGADLDFLYDDPTLVNSPIKDNIDLQIYKDSGNAGDPEFNGRFFVKLKGNGTLKGALQKNKTSDKDGNDYFAVASAIFDGVDRNYRNFWKDGVSETGIFVRWGGLSMFGSSDTSGKANPGQKAFKAHITWQQTGPHDDDNFLRRLEVGSKLRFSNDPEKVYRVGRCAKRETDGPKRNSSPCLEVDVRFEDEDGNETPLAKDLCAFKTKLTPNYLNVDLLQEKDDSKQLFTTNPAIFETEPIDSKTELNLYYEASDNYDITTHGQTQSLDWYNCISFGNGVESNRIRDDFNAVFIDNGVKASTTLAEPFKEEHKFNGIIWSGILNSRSGVNRTNEFNVANPITKDLLPSYGSIQKFHAWDDSMVILCEDKSLRVMANKSALYNADGSANLVSSSRVIGDPLEYNGEFGIGINPETFAFHGFRIYFVDKSRGVVLRLSKDGLTPISSHNMNGFFRDRLFDNTTMFGSFDNRNKLYNISFNGLDTVCFSEGVNGWVTRKSFIPEHAISLNDKYYTYNEGELWEHDSLGVDRNNFYGVQNNSEVEFVINDEPSTIKKYKTLGYEGTGGWVAKEIKTDQVDGVETSFTDKENKYFANITQAEKILSNLDLKNISTQGIGRSIAGTTSYSDQIGTQTIPTATVQIEKISVLDSNTGVDITDGSNNYWSSRSLSTNVNSVGGVDGNITLVIKPKKGYTIKPSNFICTLTDPIQKAYVSFSQVGSNVNVIIDKKIARLSGLENGDIIKIPVRSISVEIADVKISGSYTINSGNFSDNIGNGSFEIIETPNTLQKITERTIRPSEGYYINISDITIDNSLIDVKIQKLTNGNIFLTESITVPSNTAANINYVITVKTNEIIVKNKELYAKSINVSTLSNLGEDRTIKIIGDKNAECEMTFSDSSAVISTTNIELDSSGKYSQILTFPAGDTAETFTITIKTKKGTILNDEFGSTVLTITRPVVSINTIRLLTRFSGVTIPEFTTTGKVNDKANAAFEISTTLVGTGYSVIKKPEMGDVKFITNNTKTDITFTSLTITSATNDVLKLRGIINSDNFSENESFKLDLDSYVGKNVTVSFAYSNTIAGGSATSNYTSAGYPVGTSVPYTITAKGNKDYTPVTKSYYFVLTAASGYDIINGLDQDDFGIYDGSNNDVTSTFTNRLSTQTVTIPSGSSITVGFDLIPFKFPSANATYTVRPKKEIFTAQSGTAMRSTFRFLTRIEFDGFTQKNGLAAIQTVNSQMTRLLAQAAINSANQNIPTSNWDGTKQDSSQWLYQVQTTIDRTFSEYTIGQYILKNAAPTNQLIQIGPLSIPEDVYYWWSDNTTTTSKYNLTQVANNYLALAPVGNNTYTDIFGTSKSITGPFEITDSGKSLTINILANFSNTAPANTTATGYFDTPKLRLAIKNDYPNFWKPVLAKKQDRSEIGDPACALVYDKTKKYKTYFTPSKPIASGSVFYELESGTNNWILQDWATSKGLVNYQENGNPNLFNVIRNSSDGTSLQNQEVTNAYNYKYRGYETWGLQAVSLIQMTGQSCALDASKNAVFKADATGNDFKNNFGGRWEKVDGKWGISYEYGISNPALANATVTITGTYSDVRDAEFQYANSDGTSTKKTNYTNIGTNTVKQASDGKIGIITDNQFPEGIPSTIGIEYANIKGFEITDKTDNKWSSTVTLDSNGKGKLKFWGQIYNNSSIYKLAFASDQIVYDSDKTKKEMIMSVPAIGPANSSTRNSYNKMFKETNPSTGAVTYTVPTNSNFASADSQYTSEGVYTGFLKTEKEYAVVPAKVPPTADWVDPSPTFPDIGFIVLMFNDVSGGGFTQADRATLAKTGLVGWAPNSNYVGVMVNGGGGFVGSRRNGDYNGAPDYGNFGDNVNAAGMSMPVLGSALDSWIGMSAKPLVWEDQHMGATGKPQTKFVGASGGRYFGVSALGNDQFYSGSPIWQHPTHECFISDTGEITIIKNLNTGYDG